VIYKTVYYSLVHKVNRIKKTWVFLQCVLLCATSLSNAWSSDETGKNIALGHSVSFDPLTSYRLCTDPDDSKQLTDGEFADGAIWMDKRAIGWAAPSPYHIILDLGEIKPISGLMYSTSARGNAGVLWPVAIAVQVSDDGVKYHYAGDLVSLDRTNGVLPKLDEKDVKHRFKTSNLRTHGRYVVISIATTGGSYAFCDELEVYAGDTSFLSEKLPGEGVSDYHKCIVQVTHSVAISDRINRDIDAVRANIKAAKVSDEIKKRLSDQLDGFQSQNHSIVPTLNSDFKAILPINQLESSILAVNGMLMREMKFQPITIWKKHRYDRLEMTELPAKSKASVIIDAMQNEFRADSILVTNATDKAVTASLKITGVPGAPDPKWLEVSCIPWTDTASHEPVASALPPTDYVENGYKITLPAGMTRKLWLTVDTSSIPPGDHKGSLELLVGNSKIRTPFRVRVAKITMSRPRLSLQMWDYSHSEWSSYSSMMGILPTNQDSAIHIMQTHFVDTPWAQADVLPYGENLSYESFATLDKWMSRWPDARLFMVNINIGDKGEFQGAKIGTPDYNTKLGAWAKALDSHMRSLNMDPKRLGLSMMDEPRSDAQDEVVATMAKAIKASGSKITIMQNPAWLHPEKTRIQEAITLADILCPDLNQYFRGGPDVMRYWEGIKQSGHSLWFYECLGPTRTFDPTEYYRLMSWHAFKAGVVGIGFWSFGDLGGGTSSWDEYTFSMPSYAPAFLSPDGVTDSVNWQAVREGIEDYECLAMLKDAAQKSSNSKIKTEAFKVIKETVDALTANEEPDYAWKSSPRHAKVDESRIRILRVLEKTK